MNKHLEFFKRILQHVARVLLKVVSALFVSHNHQ